MVEPVEPVNPHIPPKIQHAHLKTKIQLETKSDKEQFSTAADRAGVWRKFLSGRGTQEVTEQDIKGFIMGIENFFSKVILQQNEKAWKRMQEERKKAISEG